ncbi:MAG: glycosyl hydrolase [Treponema sp.]|nr:glycosyl hydrolase [Treponema sp.]
MIWNKNTKAIWALVLITALILTGCPEEILKITKDTVIMYDGADGDMAAPPVLTMNAANGRLILEWTPSTPAADTYDIYYRQGRFTSEDDVKLGVKLNNRTSTFTIANLANYQTFSVVIVANKKGFTPTASNVEVARPSSGIITDPDLDPDPNPNPEPDPARCIICGAVEAECICPVFNPGPGPDPVRCADCGAVEAECVCPAFNPGPGPDPIRCADCGAVEAECVCPDFNPSPDPNPARCSICGAILAACVCPDPSDPIHNPNPNPNPGDPDPGSPPSLPRLVIIPVDGRVVLEWTSTNPYVVIDVYYRSGEYATAAEVKSGGTRLQNQLSPITIPGLANGQVYSVVVSARQGSYTTDSRVIPVRPAETRQPQKSPKRGVGYNFNTAHVNNASDAVRADITWADFALMAPAISWYYDWGHRPQALGPWENPNRVVERAAAEYNIEYMPMAWSDILPADLDDYMSRHPETRYLLAYNEPNLISEWESQFQLPSEAASKWGRLLAEARKHNLKVVSPAMALVGQPPMTWMDQFLAQPQVSLDDIVAISIHSYMNGPSAFRDVINRFKKYDKPVWMTEWCAWDGGAWNYHLGPRDTWEYTILTPSGWRSFIREDAKHWVIPKGKNFQMFFLSQTAMLMEMDPMLEYYAWFIPKRTGEDYEDYPWMDLITKTNPPELTDIGKVYVHMSTCDKSVWVPSGTIIHAKDFTSNNIEEWAVHTSDGWQNSVTFRPTTDPLGLTILEIWFKEIQHGYMWTEYQVNVAHSGEAVLSIRYSAPKDTLATVFLDGVPKETMLLTGGFWQTRTDISLGPVTAGRHTIRFQVMGGADSDFALNWLKVD